MIYKDIQKIETLQIIRYMESNNGKNTHHRSSAYGLYGIKPDTALEIGYHINKQNEDKVASKLYDTLCAKLNTQNPDIIVYAWLKGVYGAKKQINKPLYYRPISSHWHVKKYRKHISYYQQFQIEINGLFN